MRLWSLHPSYLDGKGLVALWREGLLAKAVLAGKTKGYTNHSQLVRFKECNNPLNAIEVYLQGVAEEGASRGYAFDIAKINTAAIAKQILVTDGQLMHEINHLKKKLAVRGTERLQEIDSLIIKNIRPHPLFTVVEGPVEQWERVADSVSSNEE